MRQRRRSHYRARFLLVWGALGRQSPRAFGEGAVVSHLVIRPPKLRATTVTMGGRDGNPGYEMQKFLVWSFHDLPPPNTVRRAPSALVCLPMTCQIRCSICLPAVGTSAAFEFTGNRHAPLAAQRRINVGTLA
jgi:hypothetical protein